MPFGLSFSRNCSRYGCQLLGILQVTGIQDRCDFTTSREKCTCRLRPLCLKLGSDSVYYQRERGLATNTPGASLAKLLYRFAETRLPLTVYNRVERRWPVLEILTTVAQFLLPEESLRCDELLPAVCRLRLSRKSLISAMGGNRLLYRINSYSSTLPSHGIF